MYKKALKILKARVGISSNKKSLLPLIPPRLEVKSLLTDFRQVEEIPFSSRLEGRITIEDIPGIEPQYDCFSDGFSFRGPFLKLSREASDLRFSFWGNQGFLYRYVLFLLEQRYQIYNLHACALSQEKRNRLFIIAGGAGSGKTVFLLSGLGRGLKLFSTETVHFRFEGGRLIWHLGSLVDNVRWSTLIRDFPQFLPPKKNRKKEPQDIGKLALDLSSYRYRRVTIPNPEVVIIFPRIEEGWQRFQMSHLDDRRKTIKLLFDNISEKLAETVLLYDRFPMLGLDTKELAASRKKAVEELVSHKTMRMAASVLANPEECWGNILETD